MYSVTGGLTMAAPMSQDTFELNSNIFDNLSLLSNEPVLLDERTGYTCSGVRLWGPGQEVKMVSLSLGCRWDKKNGIPTF